MTKTRTPLAPTFSGILLLLSACGSSPGPNADGDADADSDGDGDAEPAGFEGDEVPAAGPAAWLEATVSGAGVDVTVRARDLGAIFGISTHLAWDADALELPGAVGRSDAEVLLDPEQSGDAVALAIARPGDVALGGTRASPDAGEVTVEGEATLASLRLRATRAGRSRLELERSLLARADGTLVALPVAGGSLVVEEVTP